MLLLSEEMKKSEFTSGIKITYRVREYLAVIYIVLAVIPLSSVLYLYETGRVSPGDNILIAFVILLLIITLPVAKLLEYILFVRYLNKASIFCEDLRQGNYMVHFNLPNQKDEESAFLTFLRNLNQVAVHIRGQNRQLMNMLSDSKEKAEEMQEMAVKDSLTGLYNRRYFDAVFLKECEKTCRKGTPLSLILLDCDRFKHINDEYGHAEGDRILRVLAETMLEFVRSDTDIAVRLGGDEFAIIMPGADVAAAQRVSENMAKAYGAKDTKDTSLSIAVTSAYLSKCNDIEDQAEKLMSVTDKGVYSVKKKGGNGIAATVFTIY